MIDIGQLKRRQTVIPEVIAEVGDTLVAKDNCSIVVPFRYLQAGLLEIGNRIMVACIFPVVNNKGEYGISNYCTQMELKCDNITTTRHNGEDHYVFMFDKGDVICPNTNLVKDDNYSYLIYDEMVQMANPPWFMNYRDVGMVMSTSKQMAGVNLADTNAIFELIVAHLTRSGNDINKFYREEVNTLDDDVLSRVKKESISLNSVTHANMNKVTKLMGGYVEDGLTSALIETKNAESGVELLLRKK